MITKVTELEIISLLKYDEIFSNICKNPSITGVGSKISQLGAGEKKEKTTDFHWYSPLKININFFKECSLANFKSL